MNQIWVVIFLLFQMCCCQLRQDFIPEGGKDLPLCKELIVNSDHIVTDSYFFSHCLHPRFSSYYSHWNPSHTTENVDDEAKTSSPSVHDQNRSVLDSTTTKHLSTPNTCDWSDKKNSCFSMCDVDPKNPMSSCSNSTVPCHIMLFTPSESDMETTVIPPLDSEDEEIRIPEIDYEDNPFEGICPITPIVVKPKSLNSRINFASEKTGAVSLSKSKGMNSPSSVLTSNKYKYSLSECTRNKWFEFSLSEMVSVLSFSHADRR